jgi:hypothetical protein
MLRSVISVGLVPWLAKFCHSSQYACNVLHGFDLSRFSYQNKGPHVKGQVILPRAKDGAFDLDQKPFKKLSTTSTRAELPEVILIGTTL